VDFFVSINAMRAFNHPLKSENHLESELDPQKQTEVSLIARNEGDSDEI
jgi:hypothetical protein